MEKPPHRPDDGHGEEEMGLLDEPEARTSLFSGLPRGRLQILAMASAAALVTVAVCWAAQGNPKVQMAGLSNSVGLVYVPECQEFFAEGGACRRKNAWECIGDDGSKAYRCCCTQSGFGDFSPITGTISSNLRPDVCVDLSAPYIGSGVPLYANRAVLGMCTGGNPNKHFHLPPGGVGQIKWATHPGKCLGVKDGASFVGNEVTLQDCASGDPSWKNWNMVDGGADQKAPHRIKWATHPEKCLDIKDARTDPGNALQISDCNPGMGAQVFTVQPVNRVPEAKPSLFCTAMMMPAGYEQQMLTAQSAKNVGIFACDDTAILSNVSITIPGIRPVTTQLVPGSLQVPYGGKWHSALNTDVFIRFWDVVIQDPRSTTFSWTVKVDPDCVFFPDRLRDVLIHEYPPLGETGPAFLNNCYLGMHGPIEVLSKQAVALYKQGKLTCRTGAPYTHKQEDFYFRECWALLGIAKVDVFNILFESNYACNERPTTRDGRHPCFSRQVSFHPFKSTEAWFECHKRAISQAWSPPLLAIKDPPGAANFHHA